MIVKRVALFFLLVLLILPFMFNNSCMHDPMGIDQMDTVCFQTKILPILQTSCGMSGCHSAGGGREERGFSITDYQSIMGIVTPGSAAKSKLYQVITKVNGENMMPPNQPLTQEQRTLILVWIQQGARNTTCIPDTGSHNNGNQANMDTICFSQNIAPIIQSSCGKINCHDVISHKEGYVLTNYNTLMQNPEGIVPFNPNRSKIYNSINSGSEDIMPPPPNPPLTAIQKELLRKWIAEGALNSNCPWTTCDTTGTITYSQSVQPLIQNNCIGCHNPSNLNGNVDLSNYTQVKYYAETLRNGTPILVGAIRHKTGFIPMPPSGMLNICQLRTVDLWISQGILNN